MRFSVKWLFGLIGLIFLSLSGALWAAAPGNGAGRNATVIETSEQQSGKRVALIIGNSAYKNTRPLANPANDAEDITNALQGFGFEVIKLKNGTRRQMNEKLAEFSSKIDGAAAALVYYAGHGAQIRGENYLMPVDASVDTEAAIKDESVSLNRVLDELEGGRNRINIVMLDACRDNPVTGKFRSTQRGLAVPSSTPKGTVIVYATDPGNTAADGDGRNGTFTAGLLKAFKGRDLSLDGVLTVASAEVERTTNNRQTPYVNGPKTVQKQFLFAVTVNPGAQQIEGEFWASIKDSRDAADFEAYLEQYPKGNFRKLVENRLKSLRTAATALPAQAQTASLPVDELRQQIEVHWKANDWPKAEALSRQVIASGQAETSDYRNLRVTLTKQGKTQDAMQLRLSIAQKPGAKSDDHNGVCWAYLQQNKPMEARPYCQKAVDLQTTNWAALGNLGHTWLLTGDKAQAMPWYRKSLRQIDKEEQLKEALADFDLFIKNGWAVADAQAGKAWYEQGWNTLQKLNAVREKLTTLSKNGRETEAEAMHLALKAMNDAATLLGDDSTLVEIFAKRYMDSATDLAIRQIEKNPNATAKKTIDSAFSVVERRLAQIDVWLYWDKLAQAYRSRGQFAKALELHQTLLTAQLLQLPADDEKVLGINSEIALDHMALRQYDKALALNEKTLAALTAKLGPDHPDTISSMFRQGIIYGSLGQNDKALALYEKGIAYSAAKFGADSIVTLDFMSELGSTYTNLGQHDKALALYEKVLAARTSKLGADHPNTLTSMSDLGSTYTNLGQHDKALKLHEKVFAARTSTLGADHLKTLISMQNVSLTYIALKQYANAQALMQKLLPLWVARDGEEAETVRTYMALLVRTEEALGRSSGFMQNYSPKTQAAVTDKVAKSKLR